MKWNTKHSVEVRAKRYKVRLVTLWVVEHPAGERRYEFRIDVVRPVTYLGRDRYHAVLLDGAEGIAARIASGETAAAGLLGDYLEEHPRECVGYAGSDYLPEPAVLAAARYLQAGHDLEVRYDRYPIDHQPAAG